MWFTVEELMKELVFQAEETRSTGGHDTLEGPGCDPMARWINDGPSDTPWHAVQLYRLADDLGLISPEQTSVKYVPSSTGATAGSSRTHGEGVC